MTCFTVYLGGANQKVRIKYFLFGELEKKNQAVSEMSVRDVYSYSQFEDDNSTEIGTIIFFVIHI